MDFGYDIELDAGLEANDILFFIDSDDEVVVDNAVEEEEAGEEDEVQNAELEEVARRPENEDDGMERSGSAADFEPPTIRDEFVLFWQALERMFFAIVIWISLTYEEWVSEPKNFLATFAVKYAIKAFRVSSTWIVSKWFLIGMQILLGIALILVVIDSYFIKRRRRRQTEEEEEEE